LDGRLTENDFLQLKRILLRLEANVDSNIPDFVVQMEKDSCPHLFQIITTEEEEEEFNQFL
jgi:hypothetical protein